jgi:PKD repeat protein
MYFWSNGDTTQQSTVNTSGTYYVNVLTPAGCLGSDTIIIALNTQPVANLGPDISICQATTILDAGNPGSTYLWSNAQTTQTVSVGSGTYSVLVTDPSGCVVNDTIVVTTSTPPVVTVSQDTAICPGGTATLNASGALTYLWSNNATGSSTTVTPSVNTSYMVTGTDANGCQGSDLVIVTILPTSTALFTSNIVGATAIFTNQSTGASTYNWNFGDSSPADLTASPSHTYTVNGTYTVTLTVTGPCGTDTYTQVITITDVGIHDSEIENTLAVYPNPNNGEFTVNFTMQQATDVTVEMTDVAGRVISTTTYNNVNQVNQQMYAGDLADGVYLVRVLTADESVTKRVIIQR